MKKKLCKITALLLAAALSLGGAVSRELVKKVQTVHSRQKNRLGIQKMISQKVIKKGRRSRGLPMSRQWI